MDDPSAELETYRTLRLGMAAGGLLLGLALVWFIGLPEVPVPRSVSATYYSPIENVFVGSLIAVGLALVAVKGRPGWENGLLDVAGVLIPLVALVPTPIQDPSCRPAGTDCVPLDLVQGVELNVGAYLTLGLIALGYLWLRRWRAASTGKPWEGPTTRGLTALSALWLLVASVFLLARPAFLQYTHYAAAIAFFAILVAVVWINARRTTAADAAFVKPESWYRRWYLGIAIAMLVFVVAGVALFLATGSQNAVITATPSAPIPVIFWVEVCLLALFIGYWALQTVELWNHTVPPS
ncbi:MAG: hypothetical protein IT193_16555 [Propionibacteriaceae bacterium]|nr:hypothetical protein [Propionibacteriaceae bacterium]